MGADGAFRNALGEEIGTPGNDAFDRPLPVPLRDPPGGSVPEFVQPPDGMSAEAIGKITEQYVHGSKRVDDIAVDLGLSTREVRNAIRQYGLDRRKNEIIQQVQQEELAAYSKFLLDHRVDTAAQHLRISKQLNEAVEGILKTAADMTPEQLAKKVKPLKEVAALYRSLSETLLSSSGVGARAVALSGLPADGGAMLAQVAGKKPLVQNNFTVVVPSQAPAQPAPPRQAEVLDAEFTQEQR